METVENLLVNEESKFCCPYCGSTNFHKEGTRKGKQKYRCRNCTKYFNTDSGLKKTTNQVCTGILSLHIIKEKFDLRPKLLKEIVSLGDDLISEATLCERICGTDRNRFRRLVENNPEIFGQLRIAIRFPGEKDSKWFWGKKETIQKVENLQRL